MPQSPNVVFCRQNQYRSRQDASSEDNQILTWLLEFGISKTLRALQIQSSFINLIRVIKQNLKESKTAPDTLPIQGGKAIEIADIDALA